MKHRLLSWILALAVLATMLAPMAALAEEPITLQWYYTNDTAVPLDNDFLLKEIAENLQRQARTHRPSRP